MADTKNEKKKTLPGDVASVAYVHDYSTQHVRNILSGKKSDKNDVNGTLTNLIAFREKLKAEAEVKKGQGKAGQGKGNDTS